MAVVSTSPETSSWVEICKLDDLVNNVGVCALIDEQQIAVFKLSGDEAVYAINNHDPFSHANVMSRGVVGDFKNQPVVASPIYKQHFNLQTGQCIEDKTVKLETFPVRVVDNRVQIKRG